VLILLNWTSAATLAAALQGVTSIIDSHILSKRMPGLQVFLLLSGMALFIAGLVVLFIFPFPASVSLLPTLAAIAGAVIRTIGLVITFYNLQREEVSRVIPIIFTYPVFVAIFAIPMLGESLRYLQWLAIIIVVAGAVIISAEKSPSLAHGSLSKPFLLLFMASLLYALADIFTKYCLAYLSLWNVYCIALFSVSTVFFIMSLRTRTVKQLADIEQKSLTLGLFGGNQILALSAALLQFWAISTGPVSLVSTIIGTRPVFVAIFSIILSLILPGFLIKKSSGTRVTVLRLFSILMIVGGISIIYLT
jgi:drug/metabolite transporter (DMT)-like permease